MKIKIDCRENKLKELFNDEAIYENLHVGDIHIVDEKENVLLIIERKTIADLESSFVDGRYKEQKFRLKQLKNCKILYLLEGEIVNFNIYGSVINTMFRDGFFVFRVEDILETVLFIKKIKENIGSYDLTPLSYAETLTPRKKYYDNKSIYIQMLKQIPGISNKTAIGLTTLYPSFNIFLENINDLENIKINNRKINKKIIAKCKELFIPH